VYFKLAVCSCAFTDRNIKAKNTNKSFFIEIGFLAIVN